MQEQVAQLLRQREGHFVFESGHHGGVWLDVERLFLRPARVRPLSEALADRLRAHRVDAVCGPLIEGAFVGLMVAAALDLPGASAWRSSTTSSMRARRSAGRSPR